MKLNPFISIIIPTYNRDILLDITIESFINQVYPKELFEILIVNNNSNDQTKEIIEKWVRTSPIPIKNIFESRQGVHYARNTGAKQANGDILYFTDDDMIADSNLLSEIIKPFILENNVATVTGRVLPKWEINPPKWILDYCNNSLLSLNNPKEELIISNSDCNIFSCHQAIRKDVFFRTGGFNPENTAGEWIGDGETGLNIKIKSLGYKFAFNGKSVIYHIIPQTRMTQNYLNKRFSNQGNCDSYSEYKEFKYTKIDLIKRLVDHIKNFSIQSTIGLVKVLIGNQTWRLSRARSFYFLNRLKYDYRLIFDEKWRQLVLRDNWIDDVLDQKQN